jgi:hypothetical protein
MICAKTRATGGQAVRRGLFAMMAAVAALLVAFSAAAAGRADLFVVSVPVDATAANANAARDAARLDGARRAYAALLDRLTLARDRARLPPASDATLNDLIQGFEVGNERHSTVRYLADYTFHFRADAIERLLREQGIPFAETPSKPLIVLAVLESDKGPVLWDDPNPWREAWGNAKLPQGLVPFVVPLGEIEDVTTIDAAAAESGDAAHLRAISAKYSDGDVLVTRATMRVAGGSKAVDVTTTRFAPGEPGSEQSWVASFTANAGESDRDFLTRAAVGVAETVTDAWKQANIIDFRQTGTLVVSVPLTDLSSWIAVRGRLGAVPAIQRLELTALDRQRALVTLHYVGSAAQLRTALAQRDLDLGGSDPDWVLQRRGAATPPPDNASAPETPQQ